MTGLEQTFKLRAQEIIANSSEPILVTDALKKALLESELSRDRLAEMLAQQTASSFKGMRQRSYDIQEPLEEDAQLRFFDVPAVIGIATPQGDLLIPKDQATMDESRQWVREGEQHHRVQKLRFERAKEDLILLDDLDGDIKWTDARKMLAQRKHLELGSD